MSENFNLHFIKNITLQGFLLLVTLVSSDELFLPGKRIKSRATKPVAEICANPSGKIKRFCNGSPEGVCDATGFVVSGKIIIIFLKVLKVK